MGFGELIKQGLKSASKAMVKKGSTVSSKKIENGVVEKVNPYAKTVTIQSKDGKLRETVKADELTVKPVRRRTREESIYIADENYTPKKIGDFSETELAGMSEGEIRQRLIRDPNMQSYQDLAKAAPGDSDIMKRVRFIGQNKVPGLRKRPEEVAEKRDKFREERAAAAKELSDKKILEDLQAKREAARNRQLSEYEKRHKSPPQANDPELRGDFQKLRKAMQDYKDKGKWAKGGAVRASQGAFIEVQNRFSNRMLPNKKRTTRIY